MGLVLERSMLWYLQPGLPDGYYETDPEQERQHLQNQKQQILPQERVRLPCPAEHRQSIKQEVSEVGDIRVLT